VFSVTLSALNGSPCILLGTNIVYPAVSELTFFLFICVFMKNSSIYIM